jgi:DNA-directed RNA polymerase subunit RPC12/RpoP
MDRLRCSCGGEVCWVLTQEFDGDVLSYECWECGADFSDPNEEVVIKGDEAKVAKRCPTTTETLPT